MGGERFICVHHRKYILTPEQFPEMYVEKVHLGFKDGEGILMGYSFPNIPSPNMEPMITLYVIVPIKLQNLEKQGSKKKN